MFARCSQIACLIGIDPRVQMIWSLIAMILVIVEIEMAYNEEKNVYEASLNCEAPLELSSTTHIRC